jgi:hypothetical protein
MRVRSSGQINKLSQDLKHDANGLNESYIWVRQSGFRLQITRIYLWERLFKALHVFTRMLALSFLRL